MTIILDMDPAKAFERVAQRALDDGTPGAADRFEKEDLDWHRRLRDAFLEIARQNPGRCVVIDANRSEDALEEEIWTAVARRFPELRAGAQP
jgi:dTMP kinase